MRTCVAGGKMRTADLRTSKRGKMQTKNMQTVTADQGVKCGL